MEYMTGVLCQTRRCLLSFRDADYSTTKPTDLCRLNNLHKEKQQICKVSLRHLNQTEHLHLHFKMIVRAPNANMCEKWFPLREQMLHC